MYHYNIHINFLSFLKFRNDTYHSGGGGCEITLCIFKIYNFFYHFSKSNFSFWSPGISQIAHIYLSPYWEAYHGGNSQIVEVMLHFILKIYILIKEHMLFSLINNKQMCFFSSMNYSLKVFTTKLTSSFWNLTSPKDFCFVLFCFVLFMVCKCMHEYLIRWFFF